MGAISSKPLSTRLLLDTSLNSSGLSRRSSKIEDWQTQESDNSVGISFAGSHSSSRFCDICLDVLAYDTPYSASKYHVSYSSLERSARNGCHLCTLVRHFLPERPKHQLDELFTLSLSQHQRTRSFLVAGWRHRALYSSLLPLVDLTQFARNYYQKVESGSKSTIDIYKDFATSMVEHCVFHHGWCRNEEGPASWSPYSPTRLIEIDQTASGVKLRLATNQPSSRYVVLSHCWGSVQVVKLLSRNLEEMENDIEVSSLPQTFKDAITITTWLEVRYIWIDSCCIIQDSTEDWLEESAMMDMVYRHAYCTIAADSAADSDGGCIIEQNPLAVRPCSMVTDLGPMFCLPPESLLQTRFESEPLEQRAWALQERILSPRILHCTKDQLFWECNEDFRCLTYPDGLRANGDFRKVPRMAGMMRYLDRPRLYAQWNGVIQDYCKRSLTKEADKLMALSGIAKAFQSYLADDVYLAGLWYLTLPNALLWKVVDPTLVTTPSCYRAPSWSWASIDGKIIPNKIESDLEVCRPCLEILSCNVDLLSEDSTGQVCGGSLQVRGLMKRATWSASTHNLVLLEELRVVDNQFHETSLGRSEFSFFPDSKQEISGPDSREIYCLLIQSFSSSIEGMVIVTANRPGHFQRLGLFRATGAKACTAMKYNLRPSADIDLENPWNVHNPNDQSSTVWSEREGGYRSLAIDIPNRPHESARRQNRNTKVQPEWPEKTFTSNRNQSSGNQTFFDGKLWDFRNDTISTSSDLAWMLRKPEPSILNSIPPSGASIENTWTSMTHQPSLQTASSRKSKTKNIYATYQDRMTDPLSIYLLDSENTQTHLQRLEPKTLVLV